MQLNVLAKDTMALRMTEPVRTNVRHVMRIQFWRVALPVSLLIAENNVSATKPQTFHRHVMHYLHLGVIALQASTIGPERAKLVLRDSPTTTPLPMLLSYPKFRNKAIHLSQTPSVALRGVRIPLL